MSKYINADKLISFIDAGHLRNPNELCFSENMIVNIVGLMPPADVVEIVRCRDCRRYATDNKGEQYCPFTRGLRKPKPDDFCSYGEQSKIKRCFDIPKEVAERILEDTGRKDK